MEKNTQKRRKRTGCSVPLLLLLVIAAGLFFGRGKISRIWTGFMGESAAAPDEDGVRKRDELILFAADNQLSAGTEETMELTVLCEEQVTGPVTIADEKGQQLAVLENDGSGELKASVTFFEEEPRYGSLTASAGEAVSAPLYFYVIPEITEEMGERFLTVCTELGDYAEQAGFEDPWAEDTLKAVTGWLEKDERVSKVKPAGEGLIFETTDGLVGSYGLSRYAPNTFGYTDEDDAFEAWRSGRQTEDLFIPSEIPATNTGILHMSPAPDDRVIAMSSGSFRSSENKLAERVGGTLTWLEADDAVRKLTSGGFTDYGMSVFNTHGTLIEREDGSQMLLMYMGSRSKQEIWELMDLMDYYREDISVTRREDGLFNNLWAMVDEPGSIRWIVDVLIDDAGHATYRLKMASSYLECALGDQVFDNTILYFLVCYARSDDRMVDLLFRHGASAFIGCREALDVGLAVAFTEHMAEIMGGPRNEYSYGTFEDLLKPFSAGAEEKARTEIYPDEEDFQAEYVKAKKEAPLRLCYVGDSGDRVLAAEGNMKGTVLDSDQKKVENGDVTLYRWLDHTFREVWSGKTDSDGEFLAEKIPYGIYGIRAQKDGTMGFVTAWLKDGSKTAEADDIILEQTGAENNGGNVVRYRGNTYYWKYSGESLSSDGLFAYYPYNYKTMNQLICRGEDGDEKVLLEAGGSGPIFISGERIYLEEDGSRLFSVELNGKNRAEHENFIPWAADEGTGTLIGTKSYASGGGVWLLQSQDQSLKQISSEGTSFLGAEDGYVYYSSVDIGETAEATLWKTSLGGGETVKLGQVSSSEEWAVSGFDIYQIMKCGDWVYYSYGSYAGTGGFFQDGGINRVDPEGKNTQVCVAYGELSAEEFLALENEYETSLYYVGKDDAIGSYIGFWDDYPYATCHVKTQKNGEDTWETVQSSLDITRPGAYVCIGGEILRIDEKEGAYQTLIPEEAGFEFTDAPTGSEDHITLISQLDVVGEDLFFTVEQSARNRERDMGWRAGYDRERSVFYTMKLGGTEPVEIYEY